MATKSSADSSPSTRPLQLDWSDQDGVVTVTPRDYDRYVLRVRTAIDRLQRSGKEDKFEQQFNLLARELATWLSERDDVGNAFVTIRDGSFLFLVVTPELQCSDEFEDELSALDIKIANDAELQLMTLDVLALPDASEQALSAFLDPTTSFCFSEAPHSPHAE